MALRKKKHVISQNGMAHTLDSIIWHIDIQIQKTHHSTFYTLSVFYICDTRHTGRGEWESMRSIQHEIQCFLAFYCWQTGLGFRFTPEFVTSTKHVIHKNIIHASKFTIHNTLYINTLIQIKFKSLQTLTIKIGKVHNYIEYIR